MQRLAKTAVGAFVLALVPAAGQAAVVGYWRGDADNDGGAGLSVPNEIGSGTALTATAASVVAEPAVTPVPQTLATNLGSLNGDANINATAAFYAALDTQSITAEFWARSQEGAGFMIGRGTSITLVDAGVANATDGFGIDQFNAVRVRYFVNAGGSPSLVTLTPATAINLDSTFVHIAFTYDAATGVGNLYADGALRATNDGPDNQPLFWGSNLPLFVGGAMDGGGLSSTSATGLMDEVRISDVALAPSQFLNAPIPEPSAACLAAGGLAAMMLRRRRA